MATHARIVRTFVTPTSDDTEAEQRLGMTLELPMPPARGQLVQLPGAGRHRIDRVVVHARPSVGWTPGWRAAELIDVLLDVEPGADLAGAFAAGWKAV